MTSTNCTCFFADAQACRFAGASLIARRRLRWESADDVGEPCGCACHDVDADDETLDESETTSAEVMPATVHPRDGALETAFSANTLRWVLDA